MGLREDADRIIAATRRFLYEARPKTVFSDGLRCAYGGEMRRILPLKLRRRTKGGRALNPNRA